MTKLKVHLVPAAELSNPLNIPSLPLHILAYWLQYQEIPLPKLQENILWSLESLCIQDKPRQGMLP